MSTPADGEAPSSYETLRRRVLGAFAANSVERLMRIAEQLLLVPLLLSAWGVSRYGEWLALSSIAVISTAANLGLGQAGASDIVLRRGAGDEEGARRGYSTTIIMLTGAIFVGVVILLAFAFASDLRRIFSLTTFTESEAKFVVLLLGASLFLTFYTEPLGGAVASVMGAWLPNLIFAISKGVEIVVIAVVLRVSSSAVDVASVILGATLLNIVSHVVLKHRYVAWARFSLRSFDRAALQRTWRPALGFFSIFVFMHVVSGQVSRLLVYHVLGSAALATFAVLVTYTRAARMFASVVSRATQVEIGLAFGRGDLIRVISMQRKTMVVALTVCVVCLVFALVLAPTLVPFWTRGQVAVEWAPLLSLALVAAAGTYYDTNLQVAGAVNEVTSAALWYTACLVTGLLVAATTVGSMGLVAIAFGLLFAELGGGLASSLMLRRVIAKRLAG